MQYASVDSCHTLTIDRSVALKDTILKRALGVLRSSGPVNVYNEMGIVPADSSPPLRLYRFGLW